MDLVVIILSACVASFLTFFSGFGLGTILLPVFAVFFPLPTAIAITAVVHLLNNLFKLALVYKHIDSKVLVRFGVPALAGGFLGAGALFVLGKVPAIYSYTLGGLPYEITPIKLVIALLILVFIGIEFFTETQKFQIGGYLGLGGFFSGFFGGLSGHQGALRSMFLIQSNLSRQVYIGTGTAIACLIDVARLSIYSTSLDINTLEQHSHYIVSATLAAFAGAFMGNQLLEKVTFPLIKRLVTTLLILIALALAAGLI